MSDGAAYRYLPKSVAYLPDRPHLEAAISDVGFAHVEHVRFSAGIAQLFVATRR